jgi:GNAT superfamily N-acetyltransferase
VEIRRESFASTAALLLTRASVAELLARYDGRAGSGGDPRPSDFDPPDGVFLVGYDVGEPVACGGVCRYDQTTGEIRRMYVAPWARGRGLSRRLLAELEEEARSLGYASMRLETGNRQTQALRLYRSAGYEPIPKYGPYVDDERSVCLEKRL